MSWVARSVAGFLVLAVVCMLYGSVIVPVGYVGVVQVFGSLEPLPLYPGLAVVNPLSSVAYFNTQTQVLHFSDNVPTQEGVNVRLEASCLFHLQADSMVNVFRYFGEDVVRIMLIPQFESAVREVTSNHTAAALYTASARQIMTDSLMAQLQADAGPYGITIESTPINKLALPRLITDAIERKMQLQQEAEAMKFVLEKERQEADRKAIEAKGIASSQEIISNSTSDAQLAWNAIRATETLAGSCGARMVFVGGEDGLPMIRPGPIKKGK
eukprot:TRINITY_DN32010_c0_g1_i1.p1 TRINITY_DN32010_c0_g1~~TRINITY_DN32010_c0_g1_i1.p1  ORF type:complete len:270 (+),score=81.29 TRINITY_DN32010_c0_g1_i1:61-870(+)